MVLVLTLLSKTLVFATPFQVMANGLPVDVPIGHAAPVFADVYGDGHKELVVGQFDGGKIRVYRDHGTHQFRDFTYLKAGGKEISVDFG